MSKTIAIIPARGGSKRLPNKNILFLDKIPLLAHSILYAQANAEIIDDVYVTTNDLEIKKIALQYGAKVIDRPENLSHDLEPTVSALKQVLQNIENVENVIVMQPTNPLRPQNLVIDAFNVFEKYNVDSLFTVSRNYQKFGQVKDNRYFPFNYKIGQRSQDLEPLFYENGLLYISKSELILNDKIISENAFPFEVNHIFANVDIDTQEDFDYAEYLFQKTKTQ